MKNLRVLWVEPNISSHIIGGSSFSMLETARYLHEAVDLHILCYTQNSLTTQFLDLNIPYYYLFGIDKETHSHLLYKRPWYWRYLLSIVSRVRPTVVHINTSPIHALPWIFLKRIFRFKLVVHIRIDLKIFNKIEQFILNNVDAVICVSNYISNKTRNIGYRLPENRVIYDGIRTDVARDAILTRSQSLSLLGWNSAFRWLVLVGNIIRTKGQHIALSAMRNWLIHCPDIKVAIIGRVFDADYAQELEQMARHLKDKVELTFSGIDRPGLAYRAATIVLHTSDVESFGLTIGEAIACHRLVVTCSKGGPPEILEHLGVGIVSTPETFEEDVMKLLLDQERYYRMDSELTNLKYPWSYELTANNILNIYKDILIRKPN